MLNLDCHDSLSQDRPQGPQDEAYVKRVKLSYEELIWMASVLKYGRETIPSKYHAK